MKNKSEVRNVRFFGPILKSGIRFQTTVLLTLLFSIAVAPAVRAHDLSWIPTYEAYLDSLIAEQRAPGVAVAIVGENGPIAFITRGFRDIDARLPVTPETLYAIGSTSKAFTGILLAQIVDASDGKVQFDDPARKHRPDFRVQGDPSVSNTLTLRDLMGHWTGVGRHDFAWYGRPELNRAQLFALVPTLGVSTAPRTKFIYNNWMWLTIGVVEETLTGKSWENLIKSKIFSPLGMTASNTSVHESQNASDFSLPYVFDGKQTQAVPFYDIGAMNPAGGINSNLKDMAKWVQFQLNNGRVNGTPLLKEETFEETHKPYTKVNETTSYAMGWAIAKVNGERFLTHDGGIDGFTANVSLIPERKLGVVVLMNSLPYSAQSIARRAWQHLQGVEKPIDFAREEIAKQKLVQDEAKKAWPDPTAVAPARPLSDYAGSYCHPSYGAATVKTTNQGILAQVSVINVEALPSSENEFAVHGIFEPKKILRFIADSAGIIHTLHWRLEASTEKPVLFARCDSGESSAPSPRNHRP